MIDFLINIIADIADFFLEYMGGQHYSSIQAEMNSSFVFWKADAPWKFIFLFAEWMH